VLSGQGKFGLIVVKGTGSDDVPLIGHVAGLARYIN